MKTNKELRELAEKATPGPWHESNGLGIVIDEIDCGTVCETHEDDAHDGRFIAAANPATVMALLNEIEDLQAECEKLRKEAGLVERLAKLLPEIDDALEDLELHGTHSDKGYVKLKAWYRRMASTVNAIDAAMQRDNPC